SPLRARRGAGGEVRPRHASAIASAIQPPSSKQNHQHYLERDLESVQSAEDELFRQAQLTDAHREALAAFRERRQPRFH
ncbi:MAG: hypothetical protein L0177_05045, partial [Chloroflexi bacterium]|nr:hypothetical protein [Chloroflexota bacterium]